MGLWDNNTVIHTRWSNLNLDGISMIIYWIFFRQMFNGSSSDCAFSPRTDPSSKRTPPREQARVFFPGFPHPLVNVYPRLMQVWFDGIEMDIWWDFRGFPWRSDLIWRDEDDKKPRDFGGFHGDFHGISWCIGLVQWESPPRCFFESSVRLGFRWVIGVAPVIINSWNFPWNFYHS